MPATRTFKIGIFVLVGIAALVIAALALGIHAVSPETVDYHAYFDESVRGLEPGAPVTYRGVRVGNVSTIQVAPDHRHVDVALGLGADDVHRLGLERAVPGLRAQLGAQGLTGLKLVDLDFVDPAQSPAPPLPFTPARHSIATQQSLLSGLAGSVETLNHRLPNLADRGAATLNRVDRVLDDIRDTRLMARAGDALDQLSAMSTDVQRLVRHVDRAQLPQQVTRTLGNADVVLGQARELGRTTTASADELTRTMRDLGDAARSVRELAEELERDPEMLVKGRGRSSRR